MILGYLKPLCHNDQVIKNQLIKKLTRFFKNVFAPIAYHGKLDSTLTIAKKKKQPELGSPSSSKSKLFFCVSWDR